MLKEWASNNGVPTVDVLPRFRQAAIEEPLFYETDLHMKPAGHRLVGEAVWLPMSTLLAVPSQSVISTGNEVH